MAVSVNWDRRIYQEQDAVLPLTLPGVDGSAYTYEYTITLSGALSASVTIANAAITKTYGAPDTAISIPLKDTETDLAAGGYLHQLWRIDTDNTYPLAVGLLAVMESSRA